MVMTLVQMLAYERLLNLMYKSGEEKPQQAAIKSRKLGPTSPRISLATTS